LDQDPNAADLTTLKGALQHARKRVQEVEQKLADERAANAALASEHQAMLRSRSWQITAPLRRAMSLLRPRPPGASSSKPDDGVPKLAGIPDKLLRPQHTGVDADNATCRLLDLGPGLEGVVDDKVMQALSASPSTDVPEYLGWREAPPPIAFIGSRELQTELAFEARVLALREDNWETLLSTAKPHFLLIETVWHVDHRHWRYAMVRDSDSKELRRLMDHCRRISLPVVIWYREAPANVQHFAWLTEHADLACAVDHDVATALGSAFPNARVHHLPPAIQPALHNPLRSFDLADAARSLGTKIVFDGWWDLRKGQLPDLPRLHALREQGLLVAESRWELGRARLSDCPEFRDQVIGCLDRREKLALSRVQGAELFVANPLAGPWRSVQGAMQSAACGSVVARLDGSPAWPAAPELPGHGDDQPDAALPALLADGLAGARWRHLAWRGLMHAHTLAHRLQTISDLLSIDNAKFRRHDQRIACLLATMRPDRLEQCLQRFREDVYPDRELVVVIHGDHHDLGRYRSLVRDGEAIRILHMGSNHSLGACLNHAAAHTDAPYWTKMDDDDIYGANYLSDAMLYQQTGNHQVFGKPPMFNYLESTDELLWDPTWASYANYVHDAIRSNAALVAGGTLGGRTETLRALRFSELRRGGSDSDFILRCHEAGLAVMSMDGFNFVRYRSKQTGFHTWNMDETQARQRAQHVGPSTDLQVALV
jgi:hypothetical protein